MDWILVLALGTFALIIAFLLWNWLSTKRHHESGGTASGVGGPADPLSGNSEGIRSGPQLRESMEVAAGGTEEHPH